MKQTPGIGSDEKSVPKLSERNKPRPNLVEPPVFELYPEDFFSAMDRGECFLAQIVSGREDGYTYRFKNKEHFLAWLNKPGKKSDWAVLVKFDPKKLSV